MKPIIPFALLGALFAVGSAHAASTTPVGYVSLGNNGSIPATTDMPIAIPIDRPTEFASTVGTISGSDINLSGTPGFTANQWATGTPYVAKIESGARTGQVALITANDADSLTLSFQNSDTLAGVVAGDKVSIRKAWTIQSFFAGNNLPDFVEFGVWNNSNGVDLAPDKVYYKSGADWFDGSDDSSGNNIVIYPNEGFRLRNTSTTPITNLVVTGEVPTAASRIFIDGGAAQQDTQISFFSPVEEPISAANLGAGEFDQLLAFDLTQPGLDNAASKVYYFSSGSWYDSSDDSNVTATLKLQPGQRYIYRAEPGRADTVSSKVPAYVTNL